MLAPWEKSYDKPTQHIKKQRHYLADKGPSSQSYGFSSSHVWMWKLDSKENWCFWTVVLEKTLESPLNNKEIEPVNPKWNQSWIFIGRTDAEAEALRLWPLDVKNWLTGKDPDAGKDWRQEETGTTEDEMVGWHHWLNGHESEQAPGVDDGQGSLACCSSWSGKGSDTTKLLNRTYLTFSLAILSAFLWVLHVCSLTCWSYFLTETFLTTLFKIIPSLPPIHTLPILLLCSVFSVAYIIMW